MTHKRRWLLFSPLGLTLIGFGASLLGHSIQLKTLGAGLTTWFWWGTFSLIVLNAGVCVFAEGVKARVLLELGQAPD